MTNPVSKLHLALLQQFIVYPYFFYIIFSECVLACHTEEEIEVILYLVRHGADVNVTDRIANRNALHFVGLTGYLPLANKLLQLGCNPYKTDHYGKQPIDIAKAHGNYDVVFTLENFRNPSLILTGTTSLYK